jgi:hypothetical protein
LKIGELDGFRNTPPATLRAAGPSRQPLNLLPPEHIFSIPFIAINQLSFDDHTCPRSVVRVSMHYSAQTEHIIFRNVVVKDVVIAHGFNGGVLQFGWEDEGIRDSLV